MYSMRGIEYFLFRERPVCFMTYYTELIIFILSVFHRKHFYMHTCRVEYCSIFPKYVKIFMFFNFFSINFGFNIFKVLKHLNMRFYERGIKRIVRIYLMLQTWLIRIWIDRSVFSIYIYKNTWCYLPDLLGYK